MTLHFSDGVSINTSGPLRILLLDDGFYVVGEGRLIPVDSEEEANKIIKDMKASRIPVGDYIEFEEI